MSKKLFASTMVMKGFYQSRTEMLLQIKLKHTV